MLYLNSLNFNKFKAVQQNNLANVQTAINCGANVNANTVLSQNNVYGGYTVQSIPLLSYGKKYFDLLN